MEPTKIESQVKTEFQNRTIEPSAAAWDRLDAMLTVAEKPKKSFVWLQVAASFIGFFLIAIILFKQSKPLLDQQNINKIVTNESVLPTKEQNSNLDIKKVVRNSLVVKLDRTQNNTTENTAKTSKKTYKLRKNFEVAKVNESESAANVTIIHKSNIEITNTALSQQPDVSNQTLSVKLKYINPATLLAEIENKELIAKVQVPIKNEPYRVNAKSLLSQVDGELDISFRERVLQKITKTYQDTKVAVSDRNNAK